MLLFYKHDEKGRKVYSVVEEGSEGVENVSDEDICKAMNLLASNRSLVARMNTPDRIELKRKAGRAAAEKRWGKKSAQ